LSVCGGGESASAAWLINQQLFHLGRGLKNDQEKVTAEVHRFFTLAGIWNEPEPGRELRGAGCAQYTRQM
jgi:hypothetical protein